MSPIAKSLRRQMSSEPGEVEATPASGANSPARRNGCVCGAMTIDVEDYFQVEAFAATIDRKNWGTLPQRVDRNTQRLLDILAEAGVQATFFTLGCIAREHSSLVRRMASEGHELASHGTDHVRVDRQSPTAFRADVRESKRILEDSGGVAVYGYRAPTFSIGRSTAWAHEILAEEGYRYSSSVYPVRHDLYGSPDAPHFPFAPCPGMVEIPLTTVRVLGKRRSRLGRRLFPPVSLCADSPTAGPRVSCRRRGSDILSPSLGDRSRAAAAAAGSAAIAASPLP